MNTTFPEHLEAVTTSQIVCGNTHRVDVVKLAGIIHDTHEALDRRLFEDVQPEDLVIGGEGLQTELSPMNDAGIYPVGYDMNDVATLAIERWADDGTSTVRLAKKVSWPADSGTGGHVIKLARDILEPPTDGDNLIQSRVSALGLAVSNAATLTVHETPCVASEQGDNNGKVLNTLRAVFDNPDRRRAADILRVRSMDVNETTINKALSIPDEESVRWLIAGRRWNEQSRHRRESGGGHVDAAELAARSFALQAETIPTQQEYTEASDIAHHINIHNLALLANGLRSALVVIEQGQRIRPDEPRIEK